MQTNSAVMEAVKKELQLGKFVIVRYSAKIAKLEKKHRMSTKKFIEGFEKGRIGDEEDYFEWFALFKAKKHWEEKLKRLQVA